MIKKCAKITNDAKTAGDSAHVSRINTRMAEESIDRAELALKNAEDYINNEGKEAIRKAREAQDKSGQQSKKMTEIAKEAREEADR